jgi:hypothetical protein
VPPGSAYSLAFQACIYSPDRYLVSVKTRKCGAARRARGVLFLWEFLTNLNVYNCKKEELSSFFLYAHFDFFCLFFFFWWVYFKLLGLQHLAIFRECLSKLGFFFLGEKLEKGGKWHTGPTVTSF